MSSNIIILRFSRLRNDVSQKQIQCLKLIVQHLHFPLNGLGGISIDTCWIIRSSSAQRLETDEYMQPILETGARAVLAAENIPEGDFTKTVARKIIEKKAKRHRFRVSK